MPSVAPSLHASNRFSEPTAEMPLTVAEVAASQRVSVRTVHRWISAGQIPGAYRAGKRWRIPPAALAAFLTTGS